jgi:PAT family beta-lactamase induction signal transducer AmpG
MLLLPRLIGGYSGVLVEKLGYAEFFLITALLGIPTLVLIALQWRRERPQANGSTPPDTLDIPPLKTEANH